MPTRLRSGSADNGLLAAYSLNPLCEPNVFIVNVSATGWNQNVVPYRKVITWSELPSGYISWNSYKSAPFQQNKKALLSQEYDQRYNYFNKLKWMDLQRLVPSITLMVDYALAFLNAAGCQTTIKPTPETTQIIQHVVANNDPDVVLIRVQRNGIQDVFVSWLKLFRSLLPNNNYKVACPSSTF